MAASKPCSSPVLFLCVPLRTFVRGLKQRISGGRWLQQLDKIRHRNSEREYLAKLDQLWLYGYPRLRS